MKMAYLVDVHDSFDAVPSAMAKIGAVDLLLIGGDITTGGTPDEAAQAVEDWRSLAPRLLALAGNMDSPAIEARLVELGVALDSRGVTFGDVGVFGGSAGPKSPLDTACDRLPSGEHVGSPVIRAFIERAQPDLTLCGHIHEARGTDEIGKTQIVNPGPVRAGHYAIVEVDAEVVVRTDSAT